MLFYISYLHERLIGLIPGPPPSFKDEKKIIIGLIFVIHDVLLAVSKHFKEVRVGFLYIFFLYEARL